jgi:hypothetical protein
LKASFEELESNQTDLELYVEVDQMRKILNILAKDMDINDLLKAKDSWIP